MLFRQPQFEGMFCHRQALDDAILCSAFRLIGLFISFTCLGIFYRMISFALGGGIVFQFTTVQSA